MKQQPTSQTCTTLNYSYNSQIVCEIIRTKKVHFFLKKLIEIFGNYANLHLYYYTQNVLHTNCYSLYYNTLTLTMSAIAQPGQQLKLNIAFITE